MLYFFLSHLETSQVHTITLPHSSRHQLYSCLFVAIPFPVVNNNIDLVP